MPEISGHWSAKRIFGRVYSTPRSLHRRARYLLLMLFTDTLRWHELFWSLDLEIFSKCKKCPLLISMFYPRAEQVAFWPHRAALLWRWSTWSACISPTRPTEPETLWVRAAIPSSLFPPPKHSAVLRTTARNIMLPTVRPIRPWLMTFFQSTQVDITISFEKIRVGPWDQFNY
jgi:hypothetical protein